MPLSGPAPKGVVPRRQVRRRESRRARSARLVVAIAVTVNDLPRAILAPEDRRDAQGVLHGFCASPRGDRPLDPGDVAEVPADASSYYLVLERLAATEALRQLLECWLQLFPARAGHLGAEQRHGIVVRPQGESRLCIAVVDGDDLRLELRDHGRQERRDLTHTSSTGCARRTRTIAPDAALG